MKKIEQLALRFKKDIFSVANPSARFHKIIRDVAAESYFLGFKDCREISLNEFRLMKINLPDYTQQISINTVIEVLSKLGEEEVE